MSATADLPTKEPASGTGKCRSTTVGGMPIETRPTSRSTRPKSLDNYRVPGGAQPGRVCHTTSKGQPHDEEFCNEIPPPALHDIARRLLAPSALVAALALLLPFASPAPAHGRSAANDTKGCQDPVMFPNRIPRLRDREMRRGERVARLHLARRQPQRAGA